MNPIKANYNFYHVQIVENLEFCKKMYNLAKVSKFLTTSKKISDCEHKLKGAPKNLSFGILWAFLYIIKSENMTYNDKVNEM